MAKTTQVRCAICSTEYTRTVKQVNQVIKRKGRWACTACTAGHNRLNLIGHKYGRLTVIESAGTVSYGQSDKKAMWMCRCDCGTIKAVSGNALRSGHTTSCGCRLKEIQECPSRSHGMTETREYRIWQAMRSRCRNTNTQNYCNYGGRGIRVCDRWESFETFFADMGPCPDGFSIERLNNDGNYEPSNCVWADRTSQARNTRRNRLLTLGNETKCLREWANDLGIDQSSLRQRLDKWPLAKALTTPKRTAP